MYRKSENFFYLSGRTATGTTGGLLTLGNQSTYSYGDETEHKYSGVVQNVIVGDDLF